MVTLFVLAFLVVGDQVLLARRVHAKFGDGLYSMVGGKVEQGETAKQAIRREVLEEVALDIPEDKFKLVHTSSATSGTQPNPCVKRPFRLALR